MRARHKSRRSKSYSSYGSLPHSRASTILKERSTNETDVKKPFVAHIQQLNLKVTALQSQLTTTRQNNTELQQQIDDLKKKLNDLTLENEQLKYEISELQTMEHEDITVPITPEKSDSDKESGKLAEVDVLRRESSLKEFEIRDLRENLSLQKLISDHISQTPSKPPVSNYAPSICSTSSTISILQRKYERSASFQPKKRGMELPIKLFDCRLDDDGSNVEIDIVKIPSSKEVRIRINTSTQSEDLDIRDVYANVVNDHLFHLETFENGEGYFLCSRQPHISVAEIVEDINAFQSFGRLPDRSKRR